MVLKTLTGILCHAMQCGEESAEFFGIYMNLMGTEQRRLYLSSHGYLSFLARVLRTHTKSLSSSLSDLSLGYTLKHLVEIIVSFLNVNEIIRGFKEKEEHVEAVLSSFLTLQAMIVQKTSYSHAACQLLRDLTDKLQETESDKILFMQACIESLRTHKDSRTAQFVFERLCNMISPIREVPQYFMNLKRADSQQHYFRGNMPKNPYSTRDVGPLMEDVKKRILREMDIADVFQLELLVLNQIINLKLPVTKVYEQIHKDMHTPMEVIFRFQGVDGEATERMIDELEEDVAEDIEEKCKITSVMSKCGGLEVVIDYLKRITDFTTDKNLAKHMLQFLQYCTRLKRNRRGLLSIGAIDVLLSKCKYVFSNTDTADIAEMILLTLKPIVEEATRMSFETPSPSSPVTPGGSTIAVFDRMPKGQEDHLTQLRMFLDRLPICSPKIVDAVTNILPFLTYGEQISMEALIDYFANYLNYELYDRDPDQEKTFYLSSFVKVIKSTPNDPTGHHLKSHLMDRGITQAACAYVRSKFMGSESASYKLSSMPYVLELLTGICSSHSTTINHITDVEFLQMLHKMEENVQDKQTATLAEALLNVMSESFETRTIVNDLRAKTKSERTKKALAKRENVLKNLGWEIDNTQIVTASTGHSFDDVEEETGLVCCICGDGYTYKPESCMGIYTFSKAVYLEEDFVGFSTVTHFNVIHFECHNTAMVADSRLKPSKSEWEGAEIRNQYTKCNSLMPLLGPKIEFSDYKQVSNYKYRY
jgi:E3 ubiquitin-protein ligase UBR4